jgi:hypothetical protein
MNLDHKFNIGDFVWFLDDYADVRGGKVGGFDLKVESDNRGEVKLSVFYKVRVMGAGAFEQPEDTLYDRLDDLAESMAQDARNKAFKAAETYALQSADK